MWTCSPWALLPPAYSLGTAAGLWLLYFVAVADDRILPLTSQYRRRNGSFYAPYISNTGTFAPGSCVFSEVTNLAAFVGLVVAVLRYLQLRRRVASPWLNAGSLVAFSASCFGLTLVGNFQLNTQTAVHRSGSLMAFGLGAVFCWLQAFLTLKENPVGEGKKAAALRFLLSGCLTVCMTLHFSLMSERLHMHAARCQWASAMLLLAFIGTFAIEFRHFRFDVMCTEKSRHPVSASEPRSEASGLQPGGL